MVLVQLGLGVYAADLPVSLARLQWLSRHKSVGLAILAVILLRFAWRSMNRQPALPASMPAGSNARRERPIGCCTRFSSWRR
jgi:cytochrome b561